MKPPFRYSRLGYVLLSVRDLARTREFYTDIVGLKVSREQAGRVFLRCSDKPYDLVLREGDEIGVGRIGFEMASLKDLEKAFTHTNGLGLGPKDVGSAELADLALQAAFRIRNPASGLEIELYFGQSKETVPYAPPLAKIARLGHVVLNVADFAAEHDLWVNKLGFAVSDHVPGKIAFLRCFPNPLHHSLALIGGSVNGLNHVNFMVSDIDDVGAAIYRMKANNVPIVFGPGRHKPSESIFLYFLDPDGMTVEYSFGMEEFDEHDARGPRDLLPTPETLDMWGGTPAPEFGKLGAIVASQ